MRKHIRALILVLTCAVFVTAQQIDWSKKALQSERSRTYDALHYRIAIRLDLDQKSFEGDTTISLTSLRDGLETCVLDAEEFKVTKVVSDYGDPLQFEQTDKELKVRMPRPLKLGETRSFTCTYQGKDPKIGLRFMAESANNPKLVFSDSFPDHVHHWFPCYDYPNDKVTNEIIATVKSHLKVAANGLLVSVSEDAQAGTVTYHWSQELPHSTYLIFLAAAPYVVVQDSYKALPVNYWVYPQDEKKAIPTYGKTPKMIEFFDRIFGYEYPWQKYDQVSVPSGGGAESTSATAMTHSIMVDEKNEKDFSAIGIVSHELAHQWWGDLITLRSWAHTWMNESFGTYSDYLYHRYERGDDEGAVNLQDKLNSYLREAKTRYIRPIVTDRYDAPGEMFDRHTYPKGALVLHMLRNLDDRDFSRVVPLAPDIEDGMSGLVKPLVEEPVEVLSGDGFHRTDEIVGVDGVKSITMQEMAEDLEERFVADQVTQHVQDQGAFGIGVAVKHVPGRIVAVGDNRPDVPRLRLTQIAV